jgi:NAD kinase
VTATPFGSTGYFRSVTHTQFDAGIGLAFNNSTEAKEPLILDEPSEITVEVTRGPGQLAVDNAPEIHSVETGGRLTIRQSDAIARLVVHE